MTRPIPVHEKAFQLWYADPKRHVPKVAETFRVSERTIRNWQVKYKWRERAAAMDAEARDLADAANVKRQADMLQRHAMQGRNLAATGTNWFATHPEGIDNGRDAITAIKIGQELERKAEGLPEWILGLMGKTDDELRAEYNAIARTESGGDQSNSGEPRDRTHATEGHDIDYRLALADLAPRPVQDRIASGESQNPVDGEAVG